MSHTERLATVQSRIDYILVNARPSTAPPQTYDMLATDTKWRGTNGLLTNVNEIPASFNKRVQDDLEIRGGNPRNRWPPGPRINERLNSYVDVRRTLHSR